MGNKSRVCPRLDGDEEIKIERCVPHECVLRQRVIVILRTLGNYVVFSKVSTVLGIGWLENAGCKAGK